MFCPNDNCPDLLNTGLRSEYRLDVSVCPFCGSSLVAHQPDDPVPEGEELARKPRVPDDETLEPVLESTDPSEVAIVKSVLDAARIPFVTQGEDQLTALFRGSYLGGSILNPRSRGVVFMVPSRMAEEARVLLEDFEESETDDGGIG